LRTVSGRRGISIVIPVKNGGTGLERCLASIAAQRGEDEVEVVIVDSGSRDGSVEVARRSGATVHEIKPADFSHGASRNIGAGLSRGEWLVFISQDAFPVDDDWLRRLIAPMREDSTVAGVYGRQLPHEGARPPEIYFLGFLYGAQARRQTARDAGELSMDTTLFSNVNAAIRRSLWEKYPFVEDIIMSEDQDWSRRVLLAGYAIVYEPAAAVRHSHNYTLVAALRRFFDSGVSAERAYLAGERHSSRVLRGAALRYGRGELAWLWSTGQRRWIPYATVYEGVKLVGLTLGRNYRRLPGAVNRRLSALPDFWLGH
jgi:rhamnosyltransferase